MALPIYPPTGTFRIDEIAELRSIAELSRYSSVHRQRAVGGESRGQYDSPARIGRNHPSEAMRFARERDATAVISQFGQPEMAAIEHQWE
jgi:hypothetical protein